MNGRVTYSEAFRRGVVEQVERVKVETMNEVDELKAALADAHRDWRLENAFLDRACERLGTTAEELKKERRRLCR